MWGEVSECVVAAGLNQDRAVQTHNLMDLKQSWIKKNKNTQKVTLTGSLFFILVISFSTEPYKFHCVASFKNLFQES